MDIKQAVEAARSGDKKGFDFICDGNNISDLVNDRPGILITYKNNFKTPLIEAKLTSKEQPFSPIGLTASGNSVSLSPTTTQISVYHPSRTTPIRGMWTGGFIRNAIW